ncbi:tryptophanase leader peptide [Zophobihabitans entericus]|uniref:Tryptophanase leader peptide n=1 Tax=Zophobihabitans entericus TaxID=1635327 RepID=A0A6G9IF91_9GAMM|nr:tryptophanase leader peptide [Zophobihabitans entericus]
MNLISNLHPSWVTLDHRIAFYFPE